MKCSACGHAALVKGILQTQGEGSPIAFFPQDAHWLQRGFGIGGQAVEVYACSKCRAVQLFVESPKEDRS